MIFSHADIFAWEMTGSALTYDNLRDQAFAGEVSAQIDF